MSVFKNIDDRLEALAIKLSARLSKDRPGYPEALRTFEERRIDWTENGIRKAIIIQPTFERKGVNASLWNFINVAWIENNIPRNPGLIIDLIHESGFSEIENNIDDLLVKSEENLKKVILKDVV